MRTKLTALLMVLMLTQVSAQKNWITENFKTHLQEDKVQQYVDKGEQLLSKMSGTERDESMRVMSFFKLITGYDDAMLPVCYYDEALSALDLAVDSEEISRAVYLTHCKVGDSYYHFLLNTLANVGVNIELSAATNATNDTLKEEDNENIKLVGEAFCVTFIEETKAEKKYELASFMMVHSTHESPCFE